MAQLLKKEVRDVCCRLFESNLPCEDRFSIRMEDNLQGFGMFDGHGGYLAADIAHKNLLDMIISEVKLLSEDRRVLHENIIQIIHDSFVKCDELILTEAIRIKNQGDAKISLMNSENSNSADMTAPLPQIKQSNVKLVTTTLVKPMGRAGCCAIVLIVFNQTLYFGHTGDCRAVLFSDKGERGEIEESSKKKKKKNQQNDPAPSSCIKQVGEESSEVAAVVDEGDTKEIEVREEEEEEEEEEEKKKENENEEVDSIATLDLAVGSDFAVSDLFLEEVQVRLSSAASSSTSSSSSSSSVSGNALGQGKKRARVQIGGLGGAGGKAFCEARYGQTLEGITLDHNCYLEDEAKAVAYQTSDPNPIRPSDADRRANGSLAPPRVAGSLAVTRALGDGYLKRKELSAEPYVGFVPYITCRPTVSYRPIAPSDRAIIIATDGLWNFLTAADCFSVMKHMTDGGEPCGSIVLGDSVALSSSSSSSSGSSFVPNAEDVAPSLSTLPFRFDSHRPLEEGNDGGFVPSRNFSPPAATFGTFSFSPPAATSQWTDAASMLLDKCIEVAAGCAGRGVNELRRMKPGNSKREIIDDVTIMVLRFS